MEKSKENTAMLLRKLSALGTPRSNLNGGGGRSSRFATPDSSGSGRAGGSSGRAGGPRRIDLHSSPVIAGVQIGHSPLRRLTPQEQHRLREKVRRDGLY